MLEFAKREIVAIINGQRAGDLPEWTDDAIIGYEDISDYQYDIVDIKYSEHQSIKRGFKQGTASYITINEGNIVPLRFIFYDEFISQFNKQELNQNWVRGIKSADYLVYDSSAAKKYFIIHELSNGTFQNKRKDAMYQFDRTLKMLLASDVIRNCINQYVHKICIITSGDSEVETPMDMANGFMAIYNVLPDPITIFPGRYDKFGFKAYQTRYINLIDNYFN